jgi:hypothetical protein
MAAENQVPDLGEQLTALQHATAGRVGINTESVVILVHALVIANALNNVAAAISAVAESNQAIADGSQVIAKAIANGDILIANGLLEVAKSNNAIAEVITTKMFS